MNGSIVAPGQIAVDHPLIKEPGVYFGLPEDQYHSAFALSASGIKNLRVSTLDFWADSALNPEPEEAPDSKAKIIGSAYHKRLLEGRAAFDALYAAELDPAEHPDALHTKEDLFGALERHNIKLPQATVKQKLIAALAEADPAAKVWETLQAQHVAKHPGREFLPAAVVRQIEIAALMVGMHPQLCKAFTGGLPEVSVFWTDETTGVPFKARIDYLKPRGIVDLKSFANINRMPVRRAITHAIANHGYHIQAALYLRAAAQVRKMLAEGRIFGAVDRGFVASMLDQSAPFTWLFVFMQKGRAPVTRGVVLREGSVMDIARMEITAATDKFVECWSTFGADPWVDIEDITTLDDLEFPAYLAAA